MRMATTFTLIALLTACGPEDEEPSGPVMRTTQAPDTSESTAESRLAKTTLEALQDLSFRENTEFCGYLVILPNGEMAATPAAQGDYQSCLADEVPEDQVIIASYHTHGAFEYDTPAEFPSTGDVEGDEAEGIDGYISTPGGRMWFVDGSETTVSQLCRTGCLSQDPNFVEGLDGDIALTLTLEELRDMEMQ